MVFHVYLIGGMWGADPWDKPATPANNNGEVGDEPNAQEREIFVNAQWALGGEGSGAPVHFHNTAWNAVVYGAKKWIFYPPSRSVMSHEQILLYLETNDLMAQADSCVQLAGEVMIIPEGWAHGVLNIEQSVAVATEFKSSLFRLKPNTKANSLVNAFNNRGDAGNRKYNPA